MVLGSMSGFAVLSGLIRQCVGVLGMCKNILDWSVLGRGKKVIKPCIGFLCKIGYPKTVKARNPWKRALYPLHFPTKTEGLHMILCGILLLCSAIFWGIAGHASAWGRSLLALCMCWAGFWFVHGDDDKVKVAVAALFIATASCWVEYFQTIGIIGPIGDVWLLGAASIATFGNFMQARISHKPL